MKVWRDYDQAALDAAYDQAAWATDIDDWRAKFKRDTEAARAAIPPEEHDYGPHKLDLYRAQGTRRGLVCFIHGGAWKANTRDDAGWVAPALARAGFDVAVPDFSLLPAKRLPDVVAELLICLAWLRPMGAVNLVGHSSGAHLAACVATTEPVRSLTLVSGIYDLEPVMLSARRTYVHLEPDEVVALSPIRHVARIAAPVRCAWGTAESPEFIRQSREMAAATGAASFELPGANHFAAAYALTEGPLFRAITG
jgi:arylformamidase